MCGLEVLLIIYLVIAKFKSMLETNSRSCEPMTPLPTAQDKPKPIVTLVGAASVGKSSIGNSLVGTKIFATGVEHGTTTHVCEVKHPDGYIIRDTPGLFDRIDQKAVIWRTLPDSEIVVFVVRSQLYRQELEIVRQIHEQQRQWDFAGANSNQRKLVIFMNFNDVKSATMTKTDRIKEIDLVRAQVAALMPVVPVLVGAAGHQGEEGDGLIQVEALRNVIRVSIQGR